MNLKVIDVPIEPIPQRYSADWTKWFPNAYAAEGIEFMQVRPHNAATGYQIKRGEFLDVYNTNEWKLSQGALLMAVTEDWGDLDETVFFFHDLWNPVVLNLAYVRSGMNLPFKIAGILHAGTWDPWDFLTRRGMGKWARGFEQSLLAATDKVFVATEYHRALIEGCLGKSVTHGKIVVTDLPTKWPPENADWNKLLETKRKDQIVFPHRHAPEKQPWELKMLKDRLAGTGINSTHFFETWPNYTTKEEYYRTLMESRIAVSFSHQETWGIAMIEAVFAGCIPFVPDRLSYRELYPRQFRYGSADELDEKIKIFMGDKKAQRDELGVDKLRRSFLERGRQAIPRMLHHLAGLFK